MIAHALNVTHHSWHHHREIDPTVLPLGFVLGIHGRYNRDFAAWLDDHRFRVLTISRHPFDVLISILHFCRHDASTEQWLDGRHGTEASIRTATPRSGAFLRYATSPRAQDLLAITTDWWNRPGVVRVRYESFVADPVRELRTCVRSFGEPVADLPAVVRAHAIENLRPQVSNYHFWQGIPGLWRSLLTPAEAHTLARVHATPLKLLGYPADPDVGLIPEDADRNWSARATEPDGASRAT
jgi:hypothetical protein